MLNITIAGTFVCLPLQTTLDFWLKRIDSNYSLHFFQYNNMCQHLLQHNDSHNSVTVLMLRIEDFFQQGPSEELDFELIEKNLHSFIDILAQTAQRAKRNFFVFSCPCSPAAAPIVRKLHALEKSMVSRLSNLRNVYAYTSSECAEWYPIADIYDPFANKHGHLPYQPHGYSILGTWIARKLYGLIKRPIKVLAVDCDNTLWQGVCAEDGACGVRISEPFLNIQAFLKEQVEKGRLLCLVSKNREEDVWNVFKQNTSMMLRKEDIAAWRINWEPKSSNIIQLSDELHLGCDSFIFIDDNPLECAEVESKCPEVLTILLPKEEQEIARCLAHVWELDQLVFTDEDRRRNQYCLENRQRELLKTQSVDFLNFIKDLCVNVSIRSVETEQFDRCLQLSQRTNQYNMAARSYSAGKFSELLDNENCICQYCSVSDRFGDYGITGMFIAGKERNSLAIYDWYISCRVLGRGVEYRLLEHMARLAADLKKETIRFEYIQSDRNSPVRAFLRHVYAHTHSDWEGSLQRGLFSINVNDVLAVQWPETLGDLECCVDSKDKTPEVSKSASSESSELNKPETSKVHNKKQLLQTCIQAGSLPKLAALVNEDQLMQRPAVSTAYQAPSNAVELAMVNIFEAILMVKPIGIHDNFFELGGNSLLGIQIVSRLRSIFKSAIAIASLFEHPTISKLSALIDFSKHEDSSIGERVALQKYPLSSQQKRHWFLEELIQDSSIYGIHYAFYMSGNFNKNAFIQAVDHVIEEHEVLRTIFYTHDGELYQKVIPNTPSVCIQADISAMESISNILEEWMKKPFGLKEGSSIRIVLLKAPEKNILLASVHHSFFDKWSARIFFAEISSWYNNFCVSNDIPKISRRLHYIDFTLWQDKRMRFVEHKNAEYWKTKLNQIPRLLSLPFDKQRPKIKSYRGDLVFGCVSKEKRDLLQKYAHEHNCSMFAVVFAALAIIFNKYSGQDDVVVGVPFANRDNVDIENIIGVFVNTLPIRTRFRSDCTFSDIVTQTQTNFLEACEHNEFCFETLAEHLKIEQDISYNPIFQTIFVFSQEQDEPKLFMNGVHTTPIRLNPKTSKFDLSLFVHDTGDCLKITAEYSIDIFDEQSITQLVHHYEHMLGTAPAHPHKNIGSMSILSPFEKDQLLQRPKIRPFVEGKVLHELVEKNVAKHPGHTAVIQGDRSITYEQLNKRANQLAHFLRRLGVCPESRVAINLHRSIDLSVAILGVLKAGGTYVPLDASSPTERLLLVLADSGASIVLTQKSLQKKFNEYRGAIVLLDDCADISIENTANLSVVGTPDSLAYIIYTSGSTGKPKGVMIEHAAAINTLIDINTTFDISESDKILGLSNATFDLSVYDFFGTWIAGATLIVLEDHLAKDPVHWAALLQRYEITVWNSVPALMRMLCELYAEGGGKAKHTHLQCCLRKIFLSGDWIPVDLPNQIRSVLCSKNPMEIVSLGGATEASIWSIAHVISPEDHRLPSIPYGKPLTNQSFFVLDDHLQPCPIGVTGTLFIGGVGLARGYWNDSIKTAKSFFIHPETKERLYNTGDLGKLRADGVFIFMGRTDNQIKIRGFRIEMGEVEHAIKTFPMVSDALVTFKIDQSRSNPQLIAYVLTQEPSILFQSNLKNHVQNKLPDYMIPSAYVCLQHFPLTPNGKVDVKALPLPDHQHQTANQNTIIFSSKVEKQMAEIWKEILKIDCIAPDNRFFDLGGHSLLLVKLKIRIDEIFHIQIDFSELFKRLTIASLSSFVEEQQMLEGKKASQKIPEITKRQAGKTC